jgi:hypothetical protein
MWKDAAVAIPSRDLCEGTEEYQENLISIEEEERIS